MIECKHVGTVYGATYDEKTGQMIGGVMRKEGQSECEHEHVDKHEGPRDADLRMQALAIGARMFAATLGEPKTAGMSSEEFVVMMAKWAYEQAAERKW